MERNGKTYHVALRYPKMSDTKHLHAHINSLIDEDAMILVSEKQSLKHEGAWLKELLGKSKKGKIIVVVTEVNGVVAGLAELRLHVGRKSHVATFGISVGNKYRRMGLSTRVFALLERLAKKNGVRIIDSSYWLGNKPSQELHKKLGFRIAGKFPGTGRFANSYRSEIIVYKRLK